MKKILLFATFFMLSVSSAWSLQLAVTPRTQEKLNWDWTALSQEIFDYYGFYVSQQAIADVGTPTLSNTQVALYTDYTSPTRNSVKTILQTMYGIPSTGYSRAMTLAEITSLLNQGYLVSAQSAAGLFLIVGYSGSNLIYICSLPGFGLQVQDYSAFVAGSGYPWQTSLVLTSLPGTRPTRPIRETTVPRTYALYAFDQLYVNDGATCYQDATTTSSYCSVGNAWMLGLNNYSNTTGVTMGATAKVGSVSTSGPVFLRDRSTIVGALTMKDLTQITVQNNVTIGSKVQATIPYQGFASGTIDFTGVAQTSVGIEPDQARTYLAPGKYWNYTIKARSPIQFRAGDYYFNSLNCDVCTFEINASAGPVRIYVANSLLWTGTLSYVSGGPSRLMLAYLGTNGVAINGAFSGTILAPNASLTLAQTNKTLTGMFLARSMTVHQYSTIRFVPFLFE